MVSYVGDASEDVSLGMYTDADFASDVKASLSTSGASLKMEGPNTSFVLGALSKKQSAVSHSSTESEIIAAEIALRTEGLPMMSLVDYVLKRPIRMNFYEDNQSAIKIIETGYSQQMRHVARTHRVDIAWIKERFDTDNIDMRYIETQRQAADIFTKHFTCKFKWYGSLLSINHFPNFTAEWLLNGSPINVTEPYIQDTVPYVPNEGDPIAFDDDELADWSAIGDYAGQKPNPSLKWSAKAPKRHRKK